jgi:two-component system chemotaxis sensor kinase CheA
VTFAHGFETVLDEIRAGRLTARAEVVRTLLRAADVLSDLVRAARDSVDLGSGWRELLAELETIAHEPAQGQPDSGDDSDDFGFSPILIAIRMEEGPDASDQPDDLLIDFRPRRSFFAKAHDPLPVLRELAGLGEAEVTCVTDDLPLLDDFEPEQCYLAWSIRLRGVPEPAVRESFEFIDEDCDLFIQRPEPVRLDEPPPVNRDPLVAPVALPLGATAVEEPPASAAPLSRPSGAEAVPADAAPPQTIRVDLDRVDRLINVVGELVINQAMLVQGVSEAGLAGRPAVASGLDGLKHLTREIQESVMAIRAQPVKPLFQRMGRIVREVAGATGKVVRLRTEGESTEVDKTVVERLADPLTHLIRNAIDHGIETPERRLSAGKSAEGTVRLLAAHRSGRVVIEVSDDGGGINRARVRETAERKGLIPADAQLTEAEIDNLLFLPGFSTASVVSDISGRGVGMDVVKRSIQALGGRLTVASRPGLGSSFTMSLPLTLAVLDGMVVTVAGQTLVVPLNNVLETLRTKPGDLLGLGTGARVLSMRGAFVPVHDVGTELGFDGGFQEAAGDADRRVAVLVETGDGTRAALLIDAIQDQRQVVIKSLEANYGQVPGVAAATILGDGRVALILDVDALLANMSGSAMAIPSAADRSDASFFL